LRLHDACSAGHQSRQQRNRYTLSLQLQTEHQPLLLNKLRFVIVETWRALPVKPAAAIPY
jgi:hypothetical protein